MKNIRVLARSIYFILLFVATSINLNAQQVARTLTASNGVVIGFYEYKPTDYENNSNTKYPLIIFLHGRGERGNGTTELTRVKNNAIPKYIDRGHKMRFFWNGKWETFLVLSPQLSTSYGSWQPFIVEEMLKYAKQNLRIDTNRIFLTGLSLGGGGTWNYSSGSLVNAQKLAAIAPVCGTCSVSNPCNISNAHLPTWAFHAINDGTVNVSCTNNAINNINNCKPVVQPIKTLYNDGGHAIWDRAYDTGHKWQDINMYEWMLGQNKSLPVNKIPVANAGSDKTIAASASTVILDASASSDADGKIVFYKWKKISGPSTPVIASINSVSSSIGGFNMEGTYSFELTVADNRSGWSKDTINITVSASQQQPNSKPLANAGKDISITLPDNSVILDGSLSSDPDGSITKYEWNVVSSSGNYSIAAPSSNKTTVANLAQGTYYFRLLVTDNIGATDADTVQVKVNPKPNTAPVAKAGGDISINLPVNAVTLDGSASTDPDGTIKTFAWSLLSGNTSCSIASSGSSKTLVNNLVAGNYSFKLLVTDEFGASHTDTVNVTVKAQVNQQPKASAGKDLTIALPAVSVVADGSASNDPDGSISSFLWTMLTGPANCSIVSPKTAKTNITGLREGIYAFQLQVTDNSGAKATDTLKVFVNAKPNVSPIAWAGSDLTITLPANSVTLDGGFSSDADNNIASFSWILISGPSGASIISPTSSRTSVSNLVEGQYQFVLTVTDNQEAEDSDTIKVTVKPRPNQTPIARAGNDITITLPVNLATLDGGQSSDPEVGVLQYNWTKISGAEGYLLVNGTVAKTQVSNLKEGVYQFKLEVKDNGGLIARDTIKITVLPKPNERPRANAGKDLTAFLPDPVIALDGSLSDDPDGTISSYAWVRISGPGAVTIVNSTNNRASIVGVQEGKYIFRLTVRDDKGAEASDEVLLTVMAAPNKAPVAVAGNDTIIAVPASSAVLDAAGSFDGDGKIVGYKWTQQSGPTTASLLAPASPICPVAELYPGQYAFVLQVTDNSGNNAMDTVRIEVVNNLRYEEKLIVSPNPTRTELQLQIFSDINGTALIRVYDLNGKQVLQTSLVKLQAMVSTKLDVRQLSKGVYIAEINIEGKKQLLLRFIKI